MLVAEDPSDLWAGSQCLLVFIRTEITKIKARNTFLSTSFISVTDNGFGNLQMTQIRRIRHWSLVLPRPPYSPSIIHISFYHLIPRRSFSGDLDLILCCLLLSLKQRLAPEHTGTRLLLTHCWTVNRPTLDFFLCRQWGSAAVVCYCCCSTVCFMAQVRDQNKKSETLHV